MKNIDTHSHFNLPQFEHDLEASIARMEAAEVGTICIGVDLETSQKAVELANAHDSIWACVGQHPTEWEKEFNEEEFRKLATTSRVVVVGECGLDYYREHDRTGIEQQKALFLAHITLAHEYDLPLMLHIRPETNTMTAYDDALDMLEKYKKVWPGMRGTAHFFVGTREIAQRFLDLGFYISFSGVITFVPEYEALVAHVPLDRILPETDAPFASPTPHRGKRNQPEYVLEIVKKIASIKGLPFEEIQAQLLENTRTLFSL